MTLTFPGSIYVKTSLTLHQEEARNKGFRNTSSLQEECSEDAATCLHHAVLWDGCDGLQVAADLLQAAGHVLIKQDGQVGPL